MIACGVSISWANITEPEIAYAEYCLAREHPKNLAQASYLFGVQQAVYSIRNKERPIFRGVKK